MDRRIGPRIAAAVGDRAEALREDGELLLPRAPVGRAAVDEHDRLAFTLVSARERDTIDGEGVEALEADRGHRSILAAASRSSNADRQSAAR